MSAYMDLVRSVDRVRADLHASLTEAVKTYKFGQAKGLCEALEEMAELLTGEESEDDIKKG